MYLTLSLTPLIFSNSPFELSPFAIFAAKNPGALFHLQERNLSPTSSNRFSLYSRPATTWNNMEEIHDYGIGFILQLQNVFKNYESEMLFLSRLGDPRNAFLIYFPVAYHINCRLGLTLLWSFIFSEWLNLILKW